MDIMISRNYTREKTRLIKENPILVKKTRKGMISNRCVVICAPQKHTPKQKHPKEKRESFSLTLEDFKLCLGNRRPEEEGVGVVGMLIRESELRPDVGESGRASETLPAADGAVAGPSSNVLGTQRQIFIPRASFAFLHLLPIPLAPVFFRKRNLHLHIHTHKTLYVKEPKFQISNGVENNILKNKDRSQRLKRCCCLLFLQDSPSGISLIFSPLKPLFVIFEQQHVTQSNGFTFGQNERNSFYIIVGVGSGGEGRGGFDISREFRGVCKK